MGAAVAFAPTTAAARLAPRRSGFNGARVQARPAPVARRTVRPLAVSVSARAAKTKQAYICVDCGYIYQGEEGPFEKLPNSYRCPVCSAPKRRFKPYAGATGRNDSKSMNARWEAMQGGGGGGSGAKVDSGTLIAAGAAALVALAGLYAYLSAQYN